MEPAEIIEYIRTSLAKRGTRLVSDIDCIRSGFGVLFADSNKTISIKGGNREDVVLHLSDPDFIQKVDEEMALRNHVEISIPPRDCDELVD